MLRIAPTPSGYIHKGNLFNFWLTRDWSKKLNHALLLRIDDLDGERIKPEYLDFLFEVCGFFSIHFDFGPKNKEQLQRQWSQRLRMENYERLLHGLEKASLIFQCQCSRKQIKESGRKSGCVANCHSESVSGDNVWRFRTESNEELAKTMTEADSMGIAMDESIWQFVVRRRDGIPAYQLASLADDIHFGITHIIRGEDLLASTWAQLQMARRMNLSAFSRCSFLHHPLMQSDGEKLSKSNEAPAIALTSSARKELEEEYEAWTIRKGLLP